MLEQFQEIKFKNRFSEKRYQHILRVVKKSSEILPNNLNVKIAAYLHDIAKEVPKEQQIQIAKQNNLNLSIEEENNTELIHGRIGSFIARDEFKITDHDILNAIANHTLGRPNMSELEEIIFVADAIEATRKYPGVQIIREALEKDGIKKAVFTRCKITLNYLLEKNVYIHPQTIKTYNYYLDFQNCLLMEERDT